MQPSVYVLLGICLRKCVYKVAVELFVQEVFGSEPLTVKSPVNLADEHRESD